MMRVPSTVVAPTTLTITFVPPTFGVDLSVVTAAHLNVTRRDGSTTTWALSIVSAVPGELVAQYTFTGVDEITSTGVYTLAPVLVVPGGSVSADALSLFVFTPGSSNPLLEASAWVVATANILSLGPTKHEWVSLDDDDYPYVAIATAPWLALDLSVNSATVTLWEGLNGDNVVLSDYLHGAATYTLTLVASGSQTVPLGDGTFAASATFSSAGFVARLKCDGSRWLPW